MRDRYLRIRRVLVLVSLSTLTLSVPAFGSSADAAAAPAPSKVKPSPAMRMATVELVEHPPKQKPHSARYQLALSRDGRPSRVVSDDGAIRTTITLRQIDREQSAPLVQVEVERSERRGPDGRGPLRRSSVDVSGRVKPGRGVLVGQIARPGGGRLEVRLSLSR